MRCVFEHFRGNVISNYNDNKKHVFFSQVEPLAKSVLSRGQMGVLVAAADAIQFSTATIEWFKELLEMPNHSFMKEQMRAVCAGRMRVCMCVA